MALDRCTAPQPGPSAVPTYQVLNRENKDEVTEAGSKN